MKLRKFMIIGICLLLSGCSRASAEKDSTVSEGIVSIEEILALEKIEERLVEIGLVKRDRIGPHDNATLPLGYSQPCPLEDITTGMFDDYENLIYILSESLKEEKIEDTLQEMSRKVVILSEEGVKQLVKDEPYGIFERFLEERAYYNYKITDAEWYLVEQTEQRKDVVVKQIDKEDGWASYEIFKCTIMEDGKIDAWYSLPAISNSDENYFIEYNGLKYLCTPKRNKQGNIEGVAIHIYELEDIYGGVVYIEYIDEIKVITYTLADGKYVYPFPSYLEE